MPEIVDLCSDSEEEQNEGFDAASKRARVSPPDTADDSDREVIGSALYVPQGAAIPTLRRVWPAGGLSCPDWPPCRSRGSRWYALSPTLIRRCMAVSRHGGPGGGGAPLVE
mgnify:CR=1 FL=1